MTLSTHAAIGAVIGASTGSIWIAFVAGFISHLLVDMIPHGDRDIYEGHKSRTARKRALAFVTLDSVSAIIIVSLMFAYSDHTLNAVIAAGIIGSVLPDLVNGVYEAFEMKWLNWFHRMHFFFHNMVSDRTGDIPLRWGLFAQLFMILGLQRWF